MVMTIDPAASAAGMPAPSSPTAGDQTEAAAARSFAVFIAQLEDGDVNAGLSDALREICEHLSNHVLNYGGQPKARLTLEVGFKLDGGVFEVRAGFAAKLPPSPRGRSIYYATPGNHFTPSRQMPLFPRDVRTA